ncbi:centrosomal protein of 83 kDa-like isoform X1 [Ruditapes philippinarum]|uniref:centrosomal protein of 83 kDa-like isoform X1 n=2 Tax=Ruditapes philippinarum TaxID=129788 RepID=UPI00295B2B79|nr:centrosomal protein of 83 kDa-like isoform X1 [Ruditapes philippinarum]
MRRRHFFKEIVNVGTTMNLSFPGSPSPLGRPPLSPGAQMPKLVQETELQKLLADEKMRSQMHKTNYEQLKEENKRLQDEYHSLEEEIRRTIEESKIVQEKYKSMYEDSRREVADKQSMLEDLRNKTVTPQKLDMIKMQVSDELERSYREKYQHQESEIEELRTMCNKYKHELFFLKSEYEHEQAESRQILAEMKLQHDAEVTNLRKERESTIIKIQSEGCQDSQRVRVLQRENAQLHLKIKGLMTEMDEVRANREKIGSESESLVRIQGKQITEHQATIKSLEAERESLRRQVETVSRDYSGTADIHNKLTMRIHELEKENMIYKNRAEEVTHKSKVDLTNLKMDMLKQRGDLERERDKLSNLVEDLQVKLDITKHAVHQQDQALVDKERDCVRRVQAAREEEFEKFAKVENEKLELETKLQENERRKIDEDAHRQAEREKMEERVAVAMDAKDSAEKELLVIQTKLSHQQSVLDQLERERTENSELKSKIVKLETELSSYLGNEHDMTDENIRMRNQVELLREELRLTKEQYNKAHENHERILAQSKSALVDEKTRLELRVQELEDKLADSTKKYAKAVSVYRKYKSRSTKVIENLKYKAQILEAKREELELEKKALQSCVPQDTYNNLKKQLKDLQRRHTEFRKVIVTQGVQQIPIGDMSFASVNLDGSVLPNYSFNEQERKHQEDLKLLRQRLDLLDDNQQQQLDEFQEIAHSTLRSTYHEDIEDTSKEKIDIEKATSLTPT